MLMSNIFTNGLFDDFFDDAWFNRDMRKAEKKLYGHRGKNIMNTDIKEHDEGYELYMLRVLTRIRKIKRTLNTFAEKDMPAIAEEASM